MRATDHGKMCDTFEMVLMRFIVMCYCYHTSLFALVSYSVLLICYSAIWLLSRKRAIKLGVSVVFLCTGT